MHKNSLVPLSQVVSLVSNRTYGSKDASMPYVGLEHIPTAGSSLLGVGSAADSISTNGVFSSGDILFGKLRPQLRKCVRAQTPGYCSTDILVLRPNAGIDPTYAGYIAQSEVVFGTAIRTEEGTKMPRCSWHDLKRVNIFLPQESAIQKKIAAVLKSIDTAIEKTEALLAKHQQIKAGLMHDLFTRGVLPNGQLRPPRSEAPTLYQETALGWIPRDWTLSKIGHAFEIQLGKMLNQAARGGGSSFPYLGNRSVQWNKVEVGALEEMDFSTAEREKFLLVPGDLLVCEGGEVGRTAIWAKQLDNCYYQKAIHRLREKGTLVHPRYMLHFMWRAKTAGLFENFTSQTSIAHLTQEKLAQIPIALPVADEQRRVFERLDAVDNLIEQENAVRQNLQTQKLGLMQDLLTGRVPVPATPESTEAAT